jgi:phage terminase large subunit-like protein
MNEKGVVVTRAATSSNAAFLSKGFLEQLEDLYGGTRLMQQEMMGQVLENEGGALFSAEMLEGAYQSGSGDKAYKSDMIMAIDPSINQGGDACGLILASRHEDCVIIHKDATQVGLAPMEWARRAAGLVALFDIKAIVAESNQGGEMITTLLKLAGVTCPIKLRHASRSKSARAEPVAALYEQGRVKHRPTGPEHRFYELDEELMSLNRYEMSGPSPNRADALIWAVSELLLGTNQKPRLSVI